MTQPPEGAVIDRRTLNRTVLARQGLLERADADPGTVVERLVGLQAQVPRDPYLSLWARIRSFDPLDLERSMLERRTVRMTLMRTTLHLVTAADALALRSILQPVCERAFRGSPFARRLDGIELAEVASEAAEILDGRALSTVELGRALEERWPGRDAEALAYAARYLVPVVQVTPRGLWTRTGPPKLAPLERWLGAPLPTPGPDAVDALIVRYLRAFGPATAGDIRTWSWLTGLRPSLDRLRPSLRTYRDEAGRELLDVADGEFASPELRAPVRFLGEYDNVFLSHQDRTRVTGDLAWGTPFRGRGVFFVDGFLAGAWRLQRAGSGAGATSPAGLEVEPLRALTPVQRDEVAAEAESLAAFLAPQAAGR